MKRWVKWGAAILLLPLGFYGYRKLIPVYRVEIRSTLVMLGDLDGDHQWGLGDQKRLDEFLKDPFAFSDALGVVTQTYDYDAFGNERSPSPTDTNPSAASMYLQRPPRRGYPIPPRY